LGSGVLTGRYRDASPSGDTRLGRLLGSPVPEAQRWAAGLLNERTLRIAEEVGRIAAELNTSPAAVALAWVHRRPGIASTIVGPRTLDHLEQNLTELALPAELAERLDRLSAPANGAVNGMPGSDAA
jgi:aryl-alcohol dehydrogenase-like predicted oxidoreductase